MAAGVNPACGARALRERRTSEGSCAEDCCSTRGAGSSRYFSGSFMSCADGAVEGGGTLAPPCFALSPLLRLLPGAAASRSRLGLLLGTAEPETVVIVTGFKSIFAGSSERSETSLRSSETFQRLALTELCRHFASALFSSSCCRLRPRPREPQWDLIHCCILASDTER